MGLGTGVIWCPRAIAPHLAVQFFLGGVGGDIFGGDYTVAKNLRNAKGKCYKQPSVLLCGFGVTGNISQYNFQILGFSVW